MRRLQQVLLNFYSNALKFTGKGGLVQIICEYQPHEGQNGAVKICVKDSGCGIK